MSSYVDPKTDLVFKRVFGVEKNKALLLSLLNAILQRPEGETLTSVELLNPYTPGERINEKMTILDVKAKDERGHLYNIEMQIGPETSFTWRILFYWSRLFGSQLVRGREYNELQKTISIAITDFELLQESEHYHSTFRVMEEQQHFLLCKALEIHVLELPKYKKTLEDAQTPIEQWLSFLKDGKDMQHEQIQKWDEECKKALEEIEHLSRDEKFRWVYEDRLKGILDYYSGLKSKFREGLQKGLQEGRQEGLQEGRQEGLQEGRQEGLQEGRQEGLQEGRQEGRQEGLQEGFSQGEQAGLEKGIQTGEQIGLLKSAKKMLEAGMTPQQIADILNISVQDIQNLNP